MPLLAAVCRCSRAAQPGGVAPAVQWTSDSARPPPGAGEGKRSGTAGTATGAPATTARGCRSSALCSVASLLLLPPRRTDQLLLHLGALLALLLLLPGLQVVALLLVRIRMRSPHACCRVLQQMRFHGGSDTAAELDGFEWRSSSVV
jgi:hypothetical protein